MSTFDYPSLARSASLPLGLSASLGRDPNPAQSSGGTPRPPAEQLNPLDVPLTDVAKLHTEAERSMLPAAATPSPTTPNHTAATDAAAKASRPELHRVREVRREQGISIKRASQHLGMSVEEARRQEEPTCDLTLAQLHAWQKVCEVPVADLLVEPDCELSAPVLQRARMVRVMKTVQAILERTGQQSVKRLGQTLVNQLI